jgi:hypothetical protein
VPVELYGPVGAGASVSAPVTPAQGGTGTATVFTQGSIVYAGAAGVYSQDNLTLFHNDATNQNGIGTNLPSATLEVADTSVLGSESLTNPNLTAGTSWSVTGQCVLVTDAMTYTHGGTNTGTLTQASGTLAIAGAANQLYSFTYTISNLSAFVNIPIVTITTGFALAAVPLVINVAGVHTVIFRSAAVPGNFVINVTSASAGAFTMDTFSLKHVIGGNLTVNGNSQVNGTATATAFSGPLTGAVTGNATTATASATETIVDDVATVATMYPTWVTANTGNLPAKVSSTKLSFNPSTGLLTSTGFSGPLTGNVTGNASGTAATVTGAAQTNITSVGTLSGLTVTAAPTFSALTPGSVPFAGTAGLLSQNNANLFWDNTNKELGIGTPSPDAALHVYRNVGAVEALFHLHNEQSAVQKDWYQSVGGNTQFADGAFVIGTSTVASGAKLTIRANGSVQVGAAAIATNATDGFLYIPTCAGTPTGAPTAVTGLVPMIYDSSNNIFYIYTGGAWKQPKVAGVAAPFA